MNVEIVPCNARNVRLNISKKKKSNQKQSGHRVQNTTVTLFKPGLLTLHGGVSVKQKTNQETTEQHASKANITV